MAESDGDGDGFEFHCSEFHADTFSESNAAESLAN
jgi:hypothetical protein